jgi:hypothetical protein
VTVSGTVTNVVSIGGLSFYTLEDDTGVIPISAKDLPAKDDKITVRGVLIKDSIVGYYIKFDIAMISKYTKKYMGKKLGSISG